MNYHFPLQSTRRTSFPVLHITCLLLGLPESNCSHGSSFVGVDHKLGVIFSNAKYEAWSQHEHLHDLGNFKNAAIDLSSYGS
jgi:hypothetical protein